MKIITRDGVVINKYADEQEIHITGSLIHVVGVVKLFNVPNPAVYAVDDLPPDYQPEKYLFDGQTWLLNPNWQEPENAI